jgi:hypothetical protein
MQWQLLKLFPHVYAGALSDEELTEMQWLWLECQLLLDAGFDACPACDALSLGDYCVACGTRMRAAPRLCEQCHLPGTGAYCSHCGTPMLSETAEAIDEDRFDWDAWAQSLRPFLGGLTPQEEALLARS